MFRPRSGIFELRRDLQRRNNHPCERPGHTRRARKRQHGQAGRLRRRRCAAAAPNAGKLDREDRKEKREGLTKSIRKIKNARLDPDPSDAATPEILLDRGLHPKDTTRTDAPDPAEVVPFTLESGEYLQVVVKRPAPETHKELTGSKPLTRPREMLIFEDTRLGQTPCIALYRQNEKGRLGPPSPIQSHVIA
ncbi:MAG: hypothetical protein LBF60_04125 [Treponema sp.]|jgi:hypothetical protein|nr:hypothetical protein [Treponema sp.]